MNLAQRMQMEADSADDIIGGIQNPPDDINAPITPAQPTAPANLDTPEIMPAPVAISPTETGSGSQEVTTLKSKIMDLEGRLQDENNPTWQQRYKSLQGMFNTETRNLKAEIDRLNQLLIEKHESDSQHVFTEAFSDLSNRYGEGAAQSIIDVANQMVDQKLKTVVAPLEEKLESVTASNAANADEIFFRSLDRMYPNWKTINGWSDGTPQDPAFPRFLGSMVPATNYTYDDLLKHHYNKRDYVKVAEVFSLFRPLTATPTPTPTLDPLEKFVEPTKTGRGSVTPTEAVSETTYSQAEINGFYDSVMKRTFSGTAAERASLEAIYDKAIREGRVY